MTLTPLPTSLDTPLRDFLSRWQVNRLRFFGSQARGDARDDSDLDLVVEFRPNAHPTLLTLSRMRDELAELFGRDVDLLTEQGLRQMRNPYRRKSILSSLEHLMATDDAILFDMLDSAKLAIAYVGETSADQLGQDSMRLDAVLRRITVIGEAAKRLSPAAAKRLPDLPFNQMAKMRDFVVHRYEHVDATIVHETVRQDLTVLVERVQQMLDAESE